MQQQMQWWILGTLHRSWSCLTFRSKKHDAKIGTKKVMTMKKVLIQNELIVQHNGLSGLKKCGWIISKGVFMFLSNCVFIRYLWKVPTRVESVWNPSGKQLSVFNRGDTIHYWTQTNYGALLHPSMSSTGNTIQYHGGLQTRKFGQ